MFLAPHPRGEYECRHKKIGICKLSIIFALPKSIPVPKCFPMDTMHLFGLDISQLLISLWCGNIDHVQDDDPTTWPFAVLHNNMVWQAHGASVAGAGLYLPVCLESRVPYNLAKTISGGYKAVEYLALTHIVPEHFRVGSLTELSQWTMERTIENLGKEIQLHSDPYANLSQRVIKPGMCKCPLCSRSRSFACYGKATPLVPVTLGKTMFSWVLANIMKWMQQLLKLFKHFQTHIAGELKKDTHLASTDLQGFYQMDRLHDLGGTRRNNLLKKVHIARNVKVSQWLHKEDKTNKLIYPRSLTFC